MENNTRIDFIVHPGAHLTGRLQIPGDKSISHRALMLGSIAEGDTHITGFLESEDTIATLNAFKQMGVEFEHPKQGEIIVHGVGLDGLGAPKQPLYLGNSGTSVRLLAGLLAGQKFDSELTGDASLMQRPMRRITEPLQQMNARISCTEAGTLPMVIQGGSELHGITYKMPVASAQLKSSLLLAGLYASNKTCIYQPVLTRDHTERMLAYFGCPVEISGEKICISQNRLVGREVEVPGDISSAAFFMVAASIVKGSDLVLDRIGINPSRNAVVEILQSMGANISIEDQRNFCGEPVADIHIKSSELHGITVSPHLVSIAIDEFPAILIAAAYAQGTTVLTDAEELRVKESDRINVMVKGLTALGIKTQETENGMIVEGGKPTAGVVDSFTDHRIALAFSIAGLAADGTVTIRDCANVNTSFPGFIECAQGLGIDISVRDLDNG